MEEAHYINYAQIKLLHLQQTWKVQFQNITLQEGILLLVKCKLDEVSCHQVQFPDLKLTDAVLHREYLTVQLHLCAGINSKF